MYINTARTELKIGAMLNSARRNKHPNCTTNTIIGRVEKIVSYGENNVTIITEKICTKKLTSMNPRAITIAATRSMIMCTIID